MSAIIISAILTVVIVGASLTGWNSRFNILDAESKERSSALADACVDTILIRLAYDSSYAGGESVLVGSDTCRVLAAQNPVGNPRVFPVQAIFNHAYTNVLVTVDINAETITSWQEVPVL